MMDRWLDGGLSRPKGPNIQPVSDNRPMDFLAAIVVPRHTVKSKQRRTKYRKLAAAVAHFKSI
jgi:hypothetical protein